MTGVKTPAVKNCGKMRNGKISFAARRLLKLDSSKMPNPPPRSETTRPVTAMSASMVHRCPGAEVFQKAANPPGVSRMVL